MQSNFSIDDDMEQQQQQQQQGGYDEEETTLAQSNRRMQQLEQQDEDDQLASFDDNVHSLPTVADLQNQTATNAKSPKPTDNNDDDDDARLYDDYDYDYDMEQNDGSHFFLYFLIILVVATAIGLGVGLTQNNQATQEYNNDAKFRDTVNHLDHWGISSWEDLLDDGSPQNLALEWLIYEDDPHHFRLAFGNQQLSLELPEVYHFVARYILAVLYYSMGGKDDQWTNNLNFLSPEKHVCDWFQLLHLKTENQRVPKGVFCNNQEATKQITGLYLDSNNLQGTIPREIGWLTSLEVVNMDMNAITGTLPHYMTLLTNLEHLAMAHNTFEGSFPRWLYSNTKLQTLDLSYNLFTGTLPPGINYLTTLKALALDHNMFRGSIDGLFGAYNTTNALEYYSSNSPSLDLTNLEYLYLDDNDLEGTIDDLFMIFMTNLRRLDLSGNNLEGSIPVHFFQFPHLEVLDLNSNRNIQGQLPTIPPPERPAVLKYLALHNNSILGPIPTTIGRLSQLEHLDLSNNHLSAMLPTELGNLFDLRYLFVAQNEFDAGPLPEFLQQLRRLEELSFKATQRTGTIPSDIFTQDVLSRLILLDLDDNQLRGTIPSSIGDMRNLEFLLLNKNQLTGTIPDEFDDLISLRLFLVDGNNIHGTMDVFCNKTDYHIKPYITADCGVDGETSQEVSCSCCFHCCTDRKPCHDNNMVASLEPMWQLNYQRVFYSFDNRTVFMNYNN